MRTIALRLSPGADLKAELAALAARERVRAGWVLTCVGSLSRARLRLAGGAEHATWQGAFEIVALNGTLSQDGNHLHIAVADDQGRTVGGHLAEGCAVRTTAEVVLAVDDWLVLLASTILSPATTSWLYANATREVRDRHGPRSPGCVRPGGNRLVAARAREAAAGLTDCRPKTHAEFRPAGATRCQSLLLAGTAILGADLREWLFLLVTA
jgi:uncharacterized protein